MTPMVMPAPSYLPASAATPSAVLACDGACPAANTGRATPTKASIPAKAKGRVFMEAPIERIRP
jgi:hypothetical protein